MYGRRASQLLKEIDSSEAGQLAPFNVIPTSLYSPAATRVIAAFISFVSMAGCNFV